MSGIDWAGLMRAGLSGLRLAPEAFWRLTPAELRLMLGLEGMGPPLTRARVEELAAAFPDQMVRASTHPTDVEGGDG